MKTELVLAATFLLLFTGCSVKVAGNTGLRHGKLFECPIYQTAFHRKRQRKTIRLIQSYNVSFSEAKQELLSVISSLPRTKIIDNNDRYIHVTFTSRLMRFVDDVEFLFDDTNKQIHVRSASRVGYSDLGVNRKRVEDLRKRFYERLKIQ